MAGILHCAYFFGMFLLFRHVRLWAMLPLALGFLDPNLPSWSTRTAATLDKKMSVTL
jgi:hypothetical protein